MEKTFLRYRAGFSLAEALITILIIGLVALLSVPIAKKHVQKESELHGKWMCTINSAGQHVMWKKGLKGNSSDPNTWQTTGDSCTFDVPLKVKNFSLTAVGGGGGGAGAASELLEMRDSFLVKYPGIYRMVAIGSGGAGGMSECDVRQALGGASRFFAKAGGGGAGGAGYATVNLGGDTYKIEMSAGSAVNNSSSGDNGPNGNDSYIRRHYSGGYKDIMVAHGGGGGGRLHNDWHNCEWWADHGDAKGGAPGGIEFKDDGNIYVKKGTYDSTKGFDLCRSHVWIYQSSYRGDNRCYGVVYDITEINKYLDPSGNKKYINKESYSSNYDNDPGRGGNVGSSKGNDCSKEYYYCAAETFYGDRLRMTTSNGGMVIAVTDLVAAGGGGKAGETKGKEFYPSFPSKQLKVVIGKGGAGGVSSSSVTTVDSNINGEDGGDTYVGSWIYSGGQGGTPKTPGGGQSMPGGNGDRTPVAYRNSPLSALGGLSSIDGTLNSNSSNVNGASATGYGAGGGGGGVLVSGDGDLTVGNGGNGAPGYVIVEW